MRIGRSRAAAASGLALHGIAFKRQLGRRSRDAEPVTALGASRPIPRLPVQDRALAGAGPGGSRRRPVKIAALSTQPAHRNSGAADSGFAGRTGDGTNRRGAGLGSGIGGAGDGRLAGEGVTRLGARRTGGRRARRGASRRTGGRRCSTRGAAASGRAGSVFCGTDCSECSPPVRPTTAAKTAASAPPARMRGDHGLRRGGRAEPSDESSAFGSWSGSRRRVSGCPSRRSPSTAYLSAADIPSLAKGSSTISKYVPRNIGLYQLRCASTPLFPHPCPHRPEAPAACRVRERRPAAAFRSSHALSSQLPFGAARNRSTSPATSSGGAPRSSRRRSATSSFACVRPSRTCGVAT